jgi:hypothetical protein
MTEPCAGCGIHVDPDGDDPVWCADCYPTTDAQKYAVWKKLGVVEDAIAAAVVMAGLTPAEAEWLVEEADAGPFLTNIFTASVEGVWKPDA